MHTEHSVVNILSHSENETVSNYCDLSQYCAPLTFWLGYLSARCARSTCLRQGGNRNQNVHYAVLSMHGSFRVLKPNLTIIIKPKMGMSS